MTQRPQKEQLARAILRPFRAQIQLLRSCSRRSRPTREYEWASLTRIRRFHCTRDRTLRQRADVGDIAVSANEYKSWLEIAYVPDPDAIDHSSPIAETHESRTANQSRATDKTRLWNTRMSATMEALHLDDDMSMLGCGDTVVLRVDPWRIVHTQMRSEMAGLPGRLTPVATIRLASDMM